MTEAYLVHGNKGWRIPLALRVNRHGVPRLGTGVRSGGGVKHVTIYEVRRPNRTDWERVYIFVDRESNYRYYVGHSLSEGDEIIVRQE